MVNFRYFKVRTENFLRNNIMILLFMIICFIIGIIIGSVAANTLSYQQKQELLTYLSGFIAEVNQLLGDKANLLAREIVLSNIKLALLFWILGLTILGIVIIPLIIIIKGFILGFASTFLIREMFLKGILLAIASILPQNLIIVPSVILGGLFSFVFVLKFSKSFFLNKKGRLKGIVFAYSLSMLGVGAFLFLAALVEVFMVPSLIRVIQNFVLVTS